MDRISFLHYREITIVHTFRQWRKHTRGKVLCQRQLTYAILFYKELLLKRSLQHWKLFKIESKAKQCHKRKAATHYYRTTMVKAWQLWRGYVYDCQRKCSHKDNASTYHITHILTTCFATWKTRWDCYKDAIMLADRRCCKKQSLELLSTFQIWRSAVHDRIVTRHKETLAKQFRKLSLQRKFLEKFRDWFEKRSRKRGQTEERVNGVKVMLQKQKMSRMFNTWKIIAMEIGRRRQNSLVAVEHYSKKVCLMAINAWKMYSCILTKKTLMEAQACHFYRKINLRKLYHCWCGWLEVRYLDYHLQGQALWQWALSVQRQAFHAWISYVKVCKRKKLRYIEALKKRRLYLLRTGCRKMLQGHSEFMKEKSNAAMAQIASSSYVEYHLARKYADRWRSLVKQRNVRRSSTNGTSCQNVGPSTSAELCSSLAEMSNTFPDAVLHRLTRADFVSQAPYDNTCHVLPLHQQPITGQRWLQPRGAAFLPEDFQLDALNENTETPERQNSQPNGFTTVVPSSGSLQYERVSPSVNFTQAVRDGYAAEHVPSPLNSKAENTQLNQMITARPPTKMYLSKIAHDRGANPVLLPPSAFMCDQRIATDDAKVVSNISQNIDGNHQLTLEGCVGEEDINVSMASAVTCLLSNADMYSFVSEASISVKSMTTEEEILLIKAEMQQYYHKKECLKSLKRQKEVLENWIKEQNLSNDDGGICRQIQEEISQMSRDLRDLSHEVFEKRPEITRMIERVKALSQISDF